MWWNTHYTNGEAISQQFIMLLRGGSSFFCPNPWGGEGGLPVGTKSQLLPFFFGRLLLKVLYKCPSSPSGHTVNSVRFSLKFNLLSLTSVLNGISDKTWFSLFCDIFIKLRNNGKCNISTFLRVCKYSSSADNNYSPIWCALHISGNTFSAAHYIKSFL